MMSWFQNQKARNTAAKEAKSRGETFKGLEGSRQRRINDRLDATIDALEVKVEQGEARKLEEQDKRDAAKGAKRNRKAARKAARHGVST